MGDDLVSNILCADLNVINDNILTTYLWNRTMHFPSSGAPDVIYGFLFITI